MTFVKYQNLNFYIKFSIDLICDIVIKMWFFLAGGELTLPPGVTLDKAFCVPFFSPRKKKWVEDESLIFGLCKSSVNFVRPCHFRFLMPDQAPLS